MSAKRIVPGVAGVLCLAAFSWSAAHEAGKPAATTTGLTPVEELGRMLFFDENLSTPPGQSCAACHGPSVGFTGPVSDVNAGTVVYPGAVHTRFGNRKPPAAAYGGESPVLFYDDVEEVFVGGMFWDGRATGWTLGDPLAEQAQGPFLNPLEQNNPNMLVVVKKVAKSDYADLYEEVFGEPIDGAVGISWRDVSQAYENLSLAIGAYERSDEVNPYTSKYDYFLQGMVDLTPEEELGLELFNGQGNCAACHPSAPGPNNEPPPFTDFTYDNLGLPRNLDNPFYQMPRRWNPDGRDWIDPGLGGFLAGVDEFAHLAEENWGKHKVPTLRNVARAPALDFVKAYGHNGFFKTLQDIVHFYNTRDVEPWPDPEVPENVNTDELGDLGLTAEEEAAIVAFMRTLSDGFVP